jgi:hypothetical protein
VRTSNDVINRVIKPKVLFFVLQYGILSRANKEQKSDSKQITTGQHADNDRTKKQLLLVSSKKRRTESGQRADTTCPKLRRDGAR